MIPSSQGRGKNNGVHLFHLSPVLSEGRWDGTVQLFQQPLRERGPLSIGLLFAYSNLRRDFLWC
jgi:hypothetical protein